MEEIEKLIRQLTSDEAKVEELIKLIYDLALDNWEAGQLVGYNSGWESAMDNQKGDV